MDADKLADAAAVVYEALTNGRCTEQIEKLLIDGFPLTVLMAMMNKKALKPQMQEAT